MSCIVKAYDKKTGNTYLYESISRWDPEKKRPSPQRRCIGKLDPVTGQTIPNGKRGRPKKAKPDANALPEGGAHSKDTAALRRQLSDAQNQIQRDESRYKTLESKYKDLEAENRQLKRNLSACRSSLAALKKAFNNHCAVLEGTQQ